MKVENARLVIEPAIVKPRPGSCWTGICRAAKSTAATFLNGGNRRPSTPLRWLAAIAVEDALRRRSHGLRPDQREAVIRLMEVGSQLNNRFDGDATDDAALLDDTRWLRSSPFRETTRGYVTELYRLERQRPSPNAGLSELVDYRESVNRLSLAALWATATNRGLEPSKARFEDGDEDLSLLFHLVMLCQIIDDLLDHRADHKAGIPSLSRLQNQDLRSLSANYAASDWRSDQLFLHKLAIKAGGLLVALLLLVFKNRDNASASPLCSC